MNLQALSMIGQMGTGMADKAEGTLLSLINFIKDYKAAKRLQLSQENVEFRRTRRARGQTFREYPIVPADEDVDARVAFDLIPFARNFRGPPPTGTRRAEHTQATTFS